jgi:hypothetical protein
MLLLTPAGAAVWLQDEWLGYVREASLAAALDTHFRAKYDPAAWVAFTNADLERIFAGVEQ